MSENSNRPVYRLRYGNVVAAVWANNSQSGYFYSTTVVKIYVDEGGKWGESTSFDDRDLPSLAKAASDVHTWIHQQKANAVTVSGTDAA